VSARRRQGAAEFVGPPVAQEVRAQGLPQGDSLMRWQPTSCCTRSP